VQARERGVFGDRNEISDEGFWSLGLQLASFTPSSLVVFLSVPLWWQSLQWVLGHVKDPELGLLL
jgi:hypothetical protein